MPGVLTTDLLPSVLPQQLDPRGPEHPERSSLGAHYQQPELRVPVDAAGLVGEAVRDVLGEVEEFLLQLDPLRRGPLAPAPDEL